MFVRPLVPLVLLAVALPSQEPTPAQTQKTLRIEAGEIGLKELVDRAGETFGWNILCNPREFAMAGGTATVELQTAMDLKRDDALLVLSQLFHSKGFVLTVIDRERGMFELVSAMGPRRGDIGQRAETMTANEVLENDTLAMAVETVLELEHVNPSIMTNALRPFFAQRGTPGGGGLTLATVPNNRAAVMVSGLAPTVADAIRQIRALDKPPKEVTPTLKQQVDQLAKKVADLTALVAKLEARIAALERDR